MGQHKISREPSWGRDAILVPNSRDVYRAVGNFFIVLGLCLLSLFAAAFLQARWQEWLESQQRKVSSMTVQETWALRPLPPLVPSAPPPPKPAATPVAQPTVPPTRTLTSTLESAARIALIVTPTVPVAVPVRIVIPKISVNSRIVEIAAPADGSWATAAYAVGHYAGTALLGQAGNIVLSGHNNFEGEVFKRLSELEAGDKIQVYSADREYRFVVTSKAILRWTGASQAEQRMHVRYLLPTTQATLTLISCWPYWFYTHRIYIVAKPSP